MNGTYIIDLLLYLQPYWCVTWLISEKPTSRSLAFTSALCSINTDIQLTNPP